ncbi:hypothetical protein [uncultured Nostoc sp.]|uniref:hypothetical protein n=1 Tax=uncultured Nostoc sp. TaxID=340711 RepID=UPI0035C9D328
MAASIARRKSKGASALGGSADLFAQRLPRGEATGVQKSKVKKLSFWAFWL